MIKEQETYLGRKVKSTHEFSEKGTFQSYYAAEHWLSENGYQAGSTSCFNPVAIVKGQYNLPQKWHNIPDKDKKKVDGVMISHDWREGIVKVLIF